MALHKKDDEPINVEYSTRGSNHYVVSGPIFPARGPGRTFLRAEHALQWATRRFGERCEGLITELLREGATRWAILVRKPDITPTTE